MFSTVRVLLAEGDRDMRQQISRSLEALGFNASTVPDISSALDQFDGADILILDLDLVNGDSAMVLEKWVRKSSAPALVLARDTVKDDDMFICGAWNCLVTPFRLEVLQMLLVRYGQIVLERRHLQALETRVQRQGYWLLVTTGLALAALGPQAIPYLLKLFGGG